MYIPREFRMDNDAAATAFMKRYNFALLVTQSADRPQATHLPFHLSVQDNGLLLTAHMSKANPQWKDFDNRDVLVVFSSPHAYISPASYEKELNVPTWNYIAVHAYGKAQIITDQQQGMLILEEMMEQSDPGYMAQWKQLPEQYKNGLYQGIVPITVAVTELQAKEKLSQNKTDTERSNIVAALGHYEDGAAHDLAAYMQEKYKK